MRHILSALFGILIVAWVAPALAQDSAGEKLQRWESALTKIEQQLVANPELPADRYRDILQTVQAAREPSVGGIASYHAAYWVGALAAGLGVVAALFVRSTRAPATDAERERDALSGAPRDVLEPA